MIIMGQQSNEPQSDLHAQIARSKEEVKKLKHSSPYIFPEWQRLQNARKAADEAQKELVAARIAWFMLGSN